MGMRVYFSFVLKIEKRKLRHPNIVEIKAAYVKPLEPTLLVTELMEKGCLYLF